MVKCCKHYLSRKDICAQGIVISQAEDLQVLTVGGVRKYELVSTPKPPPPTPSSLSLLQ